VLVIMSEGADECASKLEWTIGVRPWIVSNVKTVCKTLGLFYCSAECANLYISDGPD
jgi:hypothetical protein